MFSMYFEVDSGADPTVVSAADRGVGADSQMDSEVYSEVDSGWILEWLLD